MSCKQVVIGLRWKGEKNGIRNKKEGTKRRGRHVKYKNTGDEVRDEGEDAEI